MVRRRILYLVILAALLVFQITNNNYLARFLLAVCIALPLLSLLLTLCAAGRCRLVLSSSQTIERGSEGEWRAAANNPSPLPIPRLTARLVERNLLTGAKYKQRISLTGASNSSSVSIPAHTHHCGMAELRADRVRVWDYLGLFALIRPTADPVRMMITPIPSDPGPINLPEGQGIRLRAEGTARQGRGEDYDLREYRPGDPMRSVHWKLSSKWDELIVREATDSPVPIPLITFDFFGSAEECDRRLDRLAGYCYALLAGQHPLAILTLTKDGEPLLFSVSDHKELNFALTRLLSTPLPDKGHSILNHPEHIRLPGGAVFHLHIADDEEVTAP